MKGNCMIVVLQLTENAVANSLIAVMIAIRDKIAVPIADLILGFNFGSSTTLYWLQCNWIPVFAIVSLCIEIST